jgi:hypothetical protein
MPASVLVARLSWWTSLLPGCPHRRRREHDRGSYPEGATEAEKHVAQELNVRTKDI